MKNIRIYRDALARFCSGKERMCIPAREDDDDMLLSEALDELERMRGLFDEIGSLDINQVSPSNLIEILRKARRSA